MGVNNRVSHLSGAPHASAVAAVAKKQASAHAAKRRPQSKRVVPTAASVTHEPRLKETWTDHVTAVLKLEPKEFWTNLSAVLRGSKPKTPWTCSVCGTSMTWQDKAAHLSGNHHRETLIKR
ncbi:hypothetical protein OF83DRAFT_1174118 [Amylostereum chailletii]|nr:hypothetical protein OF83DRAFT_1174118 [Amylostereum chailletii]